jgi:hypothetical protein
MKKKTRKIYFILYISLPIKTKQKSNPTNREQAILWMHDSAAATR